MEPRPKEILHYVNEAGVEVFEAWLSNFGDIRARAAILKRIDRIAEGLLGDHRYVGEGIWEIRIDFGPGYRIYYAEDGRINILLLLGGDKGSQKKDIHRAQHFWALYRSTK